MLISRAREPIATPIATPSATKEEEALPDSSPLDLPQAAFETEQGRLLQGCALAWLEQAEPDSIDLVVADPPYNLGKADWDRFPTQDAFLDWNERWVSAAHRALRA